MKLLSRWTKCASSDLVRARSHQRRSCIPRMGKARPLTRALACARVHITQVPALASALSHVLCFAARSKPAKHAGPSAKSSVIAPYQPSFQFFRLRISPFDGGPNLCTLSIESFAVYALSLQNDVTVYSAVHFGCSSVDPKADGDRKISLYAIRVPEWQEAQSVLRNCSFAASKIPLSDSTRRSTRANPITVTVIAPLLRKKVETGIQAQMITRGSATMCLRQMYILRRWQMKKRTISLKSQRRCDRRLQESSQQRSEWADLGI